MSYQCPVLGCTCVYQWRSDLKAHVLKKHFEFPVNLISLPRSSKIGKACPCPYYDCPCGYTFEKDLRRHLKIKHRAPEFQPYSIPETPCPSEADY